MKQGLTSKQEWRRRDDLRRRNIPCIDGLPDALMSLQLDTIEAQALNLSPEERARLADRLIASLFGDHEFEEAWAIEVERRVRDIEAGRSGSVPAAEAVARARAAIK